MKDSGINWLGQIPEHWMVFPLKYVATFNDETLSENTPPDFEFNYVDISSVKYGRGIVDREKITFEEAPSRARRVIQKGDTVISTVRTYLKSIATVEDDEENLIASTGFAVFRPNDSLSKEYFGYLAASSGLVGQIVAMSVGVSYPATNAYNIAQLRVPIPPADEQKEIANFLDEKTAHIDVLIEKKRKLLKLLAEKRSAIITNAVTKGINPEAPMKDSGIDWLGQIPEHWGVRRARFLADLNNPVRKPGLNPDDEVSFVPMANVGEYGGLTLDQDKPIEDIGDGYTLFSEGDVVIANITPCFENGKGAIANGLTNETAYGTTALHVVSAKRCLLPEYFFYLSVSHVFRGLGEGEMYGAGGQKRVPERFIKNFDMPFIKVDEQRKIVSHIDSHLSKIDATYTKVTEVISRLHEYRSALITEAVTGKIKVA